MQEKTAVSLIIPSLNADQNHLQQVARMPAIRQQVFPGRPGSLSLGKVLYAEDLQP